MAASKGFIARWPLFALALAPLILAAPVHAAAVLPTGGKVVSGSATISAPSASGLTIDQTSRDAIIDWSSFSIGQGASVTIDNGSGATLDRVTGPSMATLDGVMRATGSVYLIDPNGVIVGRDGIVRTGGSFIASTLDLGASNFLAGGNLRFSGTSKASVTNLGRVGSLGGNVALIAATVVNQGSLEAANGTVGLISGYRVTLRDSEHDANGLFSVQIGGADTSVTNAGLIEAADAELRAEGGNIYALAGNHPGVIRATGVKAGEGRVWLIADGGTLSVAGSIKAQGSDGAAGAIETSGQTVDLGHASIDSHGGTWLIDPDNLEITAAAAQTISTALASSNVTERTTAGGAAYTSGVLVTSGQGDITLDPGASIAWTSDHRLTLDADHNLILGGTISLADGTLDLIAGTGNSGSIGPLTGSITINAPITVSGAGTVDLTAAYDTVTVPGMSLLELSFAQGASISFGSSNQGGKLNINGQPYTLLYNMSDVAGINDSTGDFALANSLTAPQTAYSAPVTYLFEGIFEGLGNTISNLTVNTTNVDAALFGALGPGGVIRDFGLLNASITAAVGPGAGGTIAANDGGLFDNVFATGSVTGAGVSGSGYGGLVGGEQAQGVIVNSWAAVTVTTGDSGAAGGLIGQMFGLVVQSFATGAVSTGSGQNIAAGGLAGVNVGTITDSYATGPVSGGSGGNSGIGGLVGHNLGPLTDVYSTGLVTAPNGDYVGGLVGQETPGSITDGYYNSGTSGQPAGTQSNGSVGVITPTLEASLPAGFSPSVWGQIAGVSYPYLLSFYPAGTTPQVISGLARDTFTGGSIAGATVEIALNGTTDLTSATTGANGYYYVLLPQGSLPAGSTLTAWLSGATFDGATVYADAVDERIAAGASAANLGLYANTLTVITPDTSLSATYDDLAGGLGSATTAAGKDIFFTLSGVTSGHNLEIVAQGSGFAFDRGLNLGKGYLEIDASGQVSQTAAITIARLYGSSVGGASFTLTGNKIAALYGWSDPTGTLALTDGESLALDGVTDVDGLTLVSSGAVTQPAGQSLDVTGALTVTSATGLQLLGSNSAGTTSLDNSGTGVLEYDGQGTVTLTSVANAGSVSVSALSGALSIQGVVSGGSVSLASTGATLESGSGAIDTASLTLSAAGGANLGGANKIAGLAAYDGGVLTLEDGEQLVLTGTVNAGGADITLTTTAGNIVTKGTVEAATLTLDAQKGELTEASTGAIKVGTLNATADTGIVLTSADNAISNIGTDHTTSGPNEITQ